MKDNKIIVMDKSEKILNTKTYGDVLSYSYLEHLLECDKETIEFTVKMAGVKELLIDYGFVLTNVIGIGYKILAPNEITTEVMKKCVKGSMKKIEKGMRIMNHTDVSYLTDKEKIEFDNFNRILEELYRYTEDSMFEAQAVLNATKLKELGE